MSGLMCLEWCIHNKMTWFMVFHWGYHTHKMMGGRNYFPFYKTVLFQLINILFLHINIQLHIQFQSTYLHICLQIKWKEGLHSCWVSAHLCGAGWKQYRTTEAHREICSLLLKFQTLISLTGFSHIWFNLDMMRADSRVIAGHTIQIKTRYYKRKKTTKNCTWKVNFTF